MKNLIGCYPVDHSAWFCHLPQIIQEEGMVYFLIDQGSDWHFGEKFLLFESYIPELVKVLYHLNQSAFCGMGWLDYYIVSKKYHWIIGFNHHDILSCISEEGLNPDLEQFFVQP